MRLTRAGRRLARLAAVVVLGGALGPPLDAMAHRSLAAHMVQHEVLMLLFAPLAALAWPVALWLAAVPRSVRRRALRRRPVRRAWQIATSIPAAWLLHALAVWGWHAPRLFDAAAASSALHALQHASFAGTAVLFWWSLLRPGASGYGAAVASAFTTALHTGALGALLTLVPRPLYAAYAGPAALEDQQLAGLIMWVPAGGLLVVAGVGLAAAWLREAARRATRPDFHGRRP
jgi:cytochrome c oxidase assembly factor CtaG